MGSSLIHRKKCFKIGGSSVVGVMSVRRGAGIVFEVLGTHNWFHSAVGSLRSVIFECESS
jgi:hypothetical protein